MADTKLLKDRGLPKGIVRLIQRTPLVFYRLGIASMFGGRLLKLTHIGRKSGKRRETVLEVVKHDEGTGTFYVVSGWGEQSNWLRNVMVNPNVGVQFKRNKFNAKARRLGLDDASAALTEYAGLHPKAFEILTGRILGEKLMPTAERARVIAEHVPIVAFETRG